MIRKSLLTALMGRTVADATLLVRADGHIPLVQPYGTREAPVAMMPGNTVIIWQEPDGIVRMAQAGNPAELQDPSYYVP